MPLTYETRNPKVLAEMFRGELRQRAMRFVFLLRDDRNEMRSRVGGEAELFAVEQIAAGDGRAPVSLDVFDDKVGAGEVTAERLLLGVVHRVGEVSAEDDVQPLLNQLPNRKRSAEHAHVGMHAHHDHVLDAALPHQIIRLGTVGHCVAVENVERRDLPRPCPVVLVGRDRVAAAVGVVDRQRSFLRQVDPTPALQLRLGSRDRCGLSQLSLRSLLVKIHRVARTMNNERSAPPSLFDELVHARSHLADSLRRHLAPVLVPHVTDHDGRFLRVPIRRLSQRVPTSAAGAGLFAESQLE